LYGARVSLLVGTAAMLVATAVGVVIGLAAGYYGGWVDAVLMRFTEVMMTIPALLLAMALAGLMDGRVVAFLPRWLDPGGGVKMERGLVTVLLVVGAVSWTGMARVVRGQVRAIGERPFVEAARAVGCSPARIVWRHIFPNVLPTVLVLAAMSTAWTITLEAGLSFLGIGVPPPTASWGRMISEGQGYLLVAPWLVVSAGGAILLTVLGFNLLGQGLQQRWHPDRGGPPR
jgi:ABC-type dipeptide/oligopeptide/nickel transport system permease subunit